MEKLLEATAVQHSSRDSAVCQCFVGEAILASLLWVMNAAVQLLYKRAMLCGRQLTT